MKYYEIDPAWWEKCEKCLLYQADSESCRLIVGPNGPSIADYIKPAFCPLDEKNPCNNCTLQYEVPYHEHADASNIEKLYLKLIYLSLKTGMSRML